MQRSPRRLALVGPTACGKSALALLAARALGDVELVTADSMQVYRGMDIGTAKPTAAEQAEVPHHLLDVAGPGEDWDVARFVMLARRAVEGIEARGRRPLLVGGTGLYVHALVDGFGVPGRWPDVARSLEAASNAELYARLRGLDPVAAARVEPENRRRLLRALEVTLGSGRPFSSFGPGVSAFPSSDWDLAGVWLPRAVVRRRVATRFEAMLEGGLVDEVRGLLAAGPLSRTARQALGYREVLAHLEQGVALADAGALAVDRTRQFARRQRMWWRRDQRVTWFGAPSDPMDALPALLGNWGL